MPAPVNFKYRAFLSYAHADVAWGKRLHSQLEAFRIDKDLAGRDTPLGPVPKSLQPIFRDREDFSGGHTLTDATVAALDASAALIVLCSTVAATRPAVNEEVRLFRWRHPDRPVIPAMIDGTWPDNFPPALRSEIEPDGRISDRSVTILGPDLREEGDGRQLGLAKIVAGLVGVGTDEIVRRAERDRQRRLKRWIAGLSTMIVALVGLSVWAEINRRQAIDARNLVIQASYKSFEELYNTYNEIDGVAPEALRGILTQASGMIAEIKSAVPASEFPHHLQANLDCALAAANKKISFERLADNKLNDCIASIVQALGKVSLDTETLYAAIRYMDISTAIYERPPSEQVLAKLEAHLGVQNEGSVDLSDRVMYSALALAIGRAYLVRGKWENARGWFERAGRHAQAVLSADASSRDGHYALARAQSDAGKASASGRQYELAISSFREARESWDRLIEGRAFDANERYSRFVTIYGLAETYGLAGKPLDAAPVIAELVRELEVLAPHIKSSAPYTRNIRIMREQFMSLRPQLVAIYPPILPQLLAFDAAVDTVVQSRAN